MHTLGFQNLFEVLTHQIVKSHAFFLLIFISQNYEDRILQYTLIYHPSHSCILMDVRLTGGSRIFEKGGGVHLRSPSKKKGGPMRGSNFAHCYKAYIVGQKGGGSGPPGPPPPPPPGSAHGLIRVDYPRK